MSENPPSAQEQPFDPWMVERLLNDPATARDDDEQALAILFSALRSPALPEELLRQSDYLEAFAATQTLRTDPIPTRRNKMLALLMAKTTIAAAALVAVAGAGTAAYTGSLPNGLQDVAHHVVGAPAVDHTQAPDSQADPRATDLTATPSATSTPEASHSSNRVGSVHGWCTAYLHGGLATKSTTYRRLAKAAGGTNRISAFCADVAHPGNPQATAGPTSQPTGQPSAQPTATPSAHPTGQSSAHPTGQSSAHPTSQPSNTPTN
jgi:hypothetical protein